ncbi:PREDICTED: Retrovirus-related Pol poly from transposon, partial [Prunus dulcis]
DCTRMTWVSLLKTKGEVSSRFQQFYQMVETQFHARIQVLRSDNDGEFLNHDLNQFLQDHDIIHQRSCPYTPQQNGVAERKNRHLLEVVRASLFGANMPRSFWGKAVVSATYLINWISSSILNFQTPLQTLHHHIQTPPTPNLEPEFSVVLYLSTYMITNE